MRLRRRLWIAATLVVCAGVLSLIQPVRTELIGRWRGESRYQGRFTNDWKLELRRYEVVCTINLNGKISRLRDLRPLWWEPWLDKLAPSASPPRHGHVPLKAGDPAAVPVLLELLRDEDARIRLIAVEALSRVGANARQAVPALLTALEDEDEAVRTEAVWALWFIDHEAAEAAGVRVPWLSVIHVPRE
jgi:hypothetical protein